jgi:hypothetical protein
MFQGGGGEWSNVAGMGRFVLLGIFDAYGD